MSGLAWQAGELLTAGRRKEEGKLRIVSAQGSAKGRMEAESSKLQILQRNQQLWDTFCDLVGFLDFWGGGLGWPGLGLEGGLSWEEAPKVSFAQVAQIAKEVPGTAGF